MPDDQAPIPTLPPPEWNQTRTPYPRDASIHALFEEQVDRNPAAIALKNSHDSLTYADLNDRANDLARRLAALGVRAETPVAICLERSFDLIAAMLAILKAGGAYVPLDPNYPLDRLAFMLEDSGAPVILTQEKLASKLPRTSGAAVCLVEEASDPGRSGEPAPPRTPSSGDSLAYIMFTSGSSGKPKAVAIPHRGVVRLVMNSGYADFSPAETILQLSAITFDAATFEIWGALLNGGTLALPDPGQPSLDELGETIRRHGVTTALLTTGFFNLVIDERPDAVRPLRRLLVGGEALSPAHVRKALRELTSTALVNAYGPTENTTITCCHPIDPAEPLDTAVPIGRPIANTTVRILDPHLRPLPVGAPGEICVGGDGLARGYWRRPELTAERFIPDPFDPAPGARLYRTGDLGRYREDGAIEFLGRADQQIKVRGYRIELGEIESALKLHSAVRDAVVVARGEDHRKELLAYYVPRGEAVESTILRDWLRARLPEYMVPSLFLPLPAFPLTSHGKVNRAALPDPGRARSAHPAPPRNGTEKTVWEVWRTVLDLDDIGTNEDFYEIGGNSMRVVEIQARLVHRLRRSIPVTALLQYPTIGALARFLDAKAPGPALAGIPERARLRADALRKSNRSRRP